MNSIVGENIKDKVVFFISTNNPDKIAPDRICTYTYIEDVIDIMLRKQNVISNTIFYGGNKHELCLFLAGLIDNYLYHDVEIDLTNNYDQDNDFDLEN